MSTAAIDHQSPAILQSGWEREGALGLVGSSPSEENAGPKVQRGSLVGMHKSPRHGTARQCYHYSAAVNSDESWVIGGRGGGRGDHQAPEDNVPEEKPEYRCEYAALAMHRIPVCVSK